MSSKQKIEIVSASDFAKKIKNKWTLIGATFVIVVFTMIVYTGEDSKPKSRSVVAGFIDTTPENSNEKMELSRLQKQLSDMAKDSKLREEEAQKREQRLLAEIGKIKEEGNTQLEKALAEQSKKMAQELSNLEKEIGKNASNKGGPGGILVPTDSADKGKTPPPPPIYLKENQKTESKAAPERSNLPTSTVQGGRRAQQQPTIITGSTSNDGVITGSTMRRLESKKKERGNYLPAGSFAHVAIITGADFGAGKQTQSNPQPSLLRIQSDATLPNMGKYKLKNCFAIANGFGDLSSERAYLQVSRLSCLNPKTGKVLEASVLGYLADSDGKLGMRGKVERRSGMLLGKALLAGFADGAASILTTTAQNAQNTVTGSGLITTFDSANAGRAAAWGGASSAMEKLADQYIKEADSIFPVIEVDAGRKAVIIFQNGQELVWREVNESSKND